MGKTTMLVALAMINAAILAMPTTASALVPLHLNPTPVGTQTIDGSGEVLLSSANGNTFTCDSVHGSSTLNTGGTTGTMTLTYTNCRVPLFGTKCNVTTTALPFHLVTLAGEKPGVLVTTNNGHFANFSCLSFLFEVKGTGMIGTIESGCGYTSESVKIVFNRLSSGVQEHSKVSGTETSYTLKSGSWTFALDMTLTLTFPEQTELQCT